MYDINGQQGTIGALSGGGMGVASGLERGPAREESAETSWTPFFQALVIPSGRKPKAGEQRGQIPRHTDSEIKILSYVAAKFTPAGAVKFDDSFRGSLTFKSVIGSVYLYTNYKMCPSCSAVVDQFRRMFPNVHVVHGRATPHWHPGKKAG